MAITFCQHFYDKLLFFQCYNLNRKTFWDLSVVVRMFLTCSEEQLWWHLVSSQGHPTTILYLQKVYMEGVCSHTNEHTL